MRRLGVLVLCFLLALFMAACSETETQQKSFFETESLTEEQVALLKTKTVILDAGHGFDDPGCEYPENGILEKELTLVLARSIGRELEKSGITVLYTHDGETFLSLPKLDALAKEQSYDLQSYLETLIHGYSGREEADADATVEAFCAGMNDDTVFDSFERAYYANLLSAQQSADLFLSVHINAASNPASKGFDLFACSDTPYQKDASRMMSAIKDSLEYCFPDSRCRTRSYSWDDAYVVTKYVDMPSLLLECGFATNVEDAKNLTDAAWQKQFAHGVAQGLLFYLLNL